MAVRNFWVDVVVDGRQTDLSGGPRSKDGGMRAVFYVRDNGAIVKAVTVDCYTGADGQLTIAVQSESQDEYKMLLQGSVSLDTHIVNDTCLILESGQVKEFVAKLTTTR